jgi:uncharacterized damage-inducible protein DinB
MNEINRIAETLRNTFEKNAWHGPSVKETLKDITAESSAKRLPNTHSIIELVAHMTAWRIFTILKLKGDTSYKVTGELNFPIGMDWKTAIGKLEESQQQMLEALALFPAERLTQVVPHEGYKYTFFTLLHGIIHHDLYHTGQIALIKKAVG